MSDYPTVMAAFANYFGAIAQVSGALVGLVFVALTFNNKALGKDGSPGMRALARQVFADFLMVLFLALMMLVPGVPLAQMGLFLLILSSVGILRIVRNLIELLRDSEQRHQRLLLLQRFGLSFLGSLFFLTAGIRAIQGEQDSVFWSFVASAPIMLLISGSRSAWLLVTHSD
jgi:hypothetical protein